jgi:hypothetical protein
MGVSATDMAHPYLADCGDRSVGEHNSRRPCDLVRHSLTCDQTRPNYEQGRSESNAQPAALETAALPIELRPFPLEIADFKLQIESDAAASDSRCNLQFEIYNLQSFFS